MRVDEQLRRFVGVGINVGEGFFVGRKCDAMIAGLLGELVARASVDAHGIKVPIEGAHFAGGEVKRVAVAGELDGADLELAGDEGLRVASIEGNLEQIRVAVLLAEEINLVAVFHPADASRRLRTRRRLRRR